MESLMGKWKHIKTENLQVYLKEHGMSDETLAQMTGKEWNYILEYAMEGDKVKCSVEFTEPPGIPTKSYLLTPGAWCDIEGMFGDQIEYLLKGEGDKVTEDHKNKKSGTTWTGEKKFQGNQMISTNTLNNITMTATFERL